MLVTRGPIEITSKLLMLENLIDFKIEILIFSLLISVVCIYSSPPLLKS